MASIKIITDSACDLTDDVLAAHGIGMVPLSIRFDDEEFTDRTELSTAEFWTRSATSATLPSTAAPSPGAFAESFRAAKAEGHDAVICITLSSDLSATFQSATAGREDVKDEIEVHIVDSRTVTIGEGILVLAAVEAAKTAGSAAVLADTLRAQAEQQTLLGALDTLDNLRKGGRIGAAGAFFAAILSIKPVITITDGVVKPLAKQRTRSKALKFLAEQVIEAGAITDVGISHSGAPDVDEFIDLLAPKVKREDIIVTEMGPTIGVHGGPRLIAISYRKFTVQ